MCCNDRRSGTESSRSASVVLAELGLLPQVLHNITLQKLIVVVSLISAILIGMVENFSTSNGREINDFERTRAAMNDNLRTSPQGRGPCYRGCYALPEVSADQKETIRRETIRESFIVQRRLAREPAGLGWPRQFAGGTAVLPVWAWNAPCFHERSGAVPFVWPTRGAPVLKKIDRLQEDLDCLTRKLQLEIAELQRCNQQHDEQSPLS